ncbi:DNA repair exonuclease [Mycoplasmatota bacterium WC30]
MIKIMHLSDIHLGATLVKSTYGSVFALKRQMEIKDTFFKSLKYAQDKNVDYLIISGDLFDSEFMKMSEVKSVFKSLENLKTQVLIIAGNHDPLKKDTFWDTLKLSDNIKIFNDTLSKIEYPEHNLVFYGHSWNRSYIYDKVFNNIADIDTSKINILVAHGDVYNKKSSYLPIDKSNLSKLGFDYVALGHIHKKDFITERIAYAGSLEPFDFSETGEHGFIYIELDKKQIKIKFIPFAKREFVVKELELDGAMTDSDIFDLIRNVDSEEKKYKNMYRIVFIGRYDYQIDLDEDRMNERFRDEFTYVEFKNKAKYSFDIESLKKENAENIIGKFIQKMEELDLDASEKERVLNTGLEYLLNSKEGTL